MNGLRGFDLEPKTGGRIRLLVPNRRRAARSLSSFLVVDENTVAAA